MDGINVDKKKTSEIIIFSLVLLIVELVFIILFNIKHVIMRQRKRVDGTVLVKTT